MSREIVIGSRGSDLALWQANFIKGELEKLGEKVRIQIIKTQGDIIQHLSFDKMEGKGFFTKELETALRSEEIDLAVHSFKDLETNQPDDLTIAAVSHRASPADVLLIKKDAVDEDQKWNLKKNPIVGTSSARRKVQLLHHRPDVSIRDIRGNVPTRIGKLRDQDFDAIVLAKAGMDRLKVDVSDLHVFEFNPKEFVSAPAQGVLACQTRASHQRLIDVLKKVNQPEVSELVGVERKILNMFHGGCQMPLGAYCIQEGGKYRVWAAMADDSSAPLR
ncbi:MAG: hydroxymethylbilane synthase, partial [Flavobacteriales bacterium]|nr:hydroxymethylbilane synthase [Flavobacteriales bacterium]